MNQSIKNVVAIFSIVLFCTFLPSRVSSADRLMVKNASGTTTFKVEDDGSISSAARLVTNGASAWGSAPFVLGQDVLNRGIVITDKAESNQKNIYIGWNVGSSQDYGEIFALQEGVAYKNMVFNPHGGYVGIGTTSPGYPLQMGSGAYVSAGGVWTNASSRERKQDITVLGYNEAVDALEVLNPVKFSYKANPEEKHVGFIAEDAPQLVATRDRKGMSPMDVVALLTRVVQEQQKTIEKLSRKMAELESHRR